MNPTEGEMSVEQGAKVVAAEQHTGFKCEACGETFQSLRVRGQHTWRKHGKKGTRNWERRRRKAAPKPASQAVPEPQTGVNLLRDITATAAAMDAAARKLEDEAEKKRKQAKRLREVAAELGTF